MAAAAEREDERAGRPGGGRVAPPMPWWLFAALPVAVAIAWANAFPGTFQFDDYAVIVDNPAVQRWTAFVASMPGIRPLLKASYTFSWTVGGGAPTAFVAFNVAVHAANAVLVMLLARARARAGGAGTAAADGHRRRDRIAVRAASGADRGGDLDRRPRDVAVGMLRPRLGPPLARGGRRRRGRRRRARTPAPQRGDGGLRRRARRQGDRGDAAVRAAAARSAAAGPARSGEPRAGRRAGAPVARCAARDGAAIRPAGAGRRRRMVGADVPPAGRREPRYARTLRQPRRAGRRDRLPGHRPAAAAAREHRSRGAADGVRAAMVAGGSGVDGGGAGRGGGTVGTTRGPPARGVALAAGRVRPRLVPAAPRADQFPAGALRPRQRPPALPRAAGPGAAGRGGAAGMARAAGGEGAARGAGAAGDA